MSLLTLAKELLVHSGKSLRISTMTHRLECQLFIGKRGYGKTVTLRGKMQKLIDAGVPVVLFDIQGNLARKIAAYASKKNKEHLLIYDKASEAKKNPRWKWMIEPQGDNELERQIQREMAVGSFMLMFLAKMNAKLADDTPMIKKYLEVAIRVWASMPSPVPLWWMRQLFRIGTPEYQWMMKDAQDRDAVWVFEQAELLGRQSRVQYEAQVGGAARRVEALMSVILWARHGDDSIDWIDVAEQGKIVLFDLSGIPLDSARTLTIAATNAIATALRIRFARTGKPCPIVVVLEEMGAVKSVTPALLDNMREMRQHGFYVWGVTQTPSDLGDDFKTFAELCGVLNVHLLTTDLDLISPMFSRPTFDANEEHYRRNRKSPTGQKEIERKGRSVTHIDGEERVTTNEGTQFITQYEDIQDVYFKSPQVHQAEIEQIITTLNLGEMIEIGSQRPRKVSVPMPEEPWPKGDTFLPSWGMTLFDKRVNEVIERVRNSSIYHVPVWQQTPPPPSSPPKAKGKPKASPPKPKGRGAASKSPPKGGGKSKR